MAALALVLSLVTFILAGLGVTLFHLSELDEIAFGLALYVLSALVGAVPNVTVARK